jgi:hypothetical protein
LYKLVEDIKQIFKSEVKTSLDKWLADASCTNFKHLKTFTNEIYADLNVVKMH